MTSAATARATLLRRFATLCKVALFVICHVLLAMSIPCLATGQPDKSQADDESRQRLDFMQSTIERFRVSSEVVSPPSRLKLSGKPLLRYNDPTRGLGDQTDGLLDATMWRVGEGRRPTAFLTLEIYRRREGGDVMSYEFVSLTPAGLSMVL